MQITLPLFLTGSITVAELEQFVKTARDLGATDGTEIEVRALERDDSVLDGLFLDSETLKPTAESAA
ncbi:hypothetical protein [Nocardia brasiliensis]|uniref:hypothetical protein n=1 Tax=Nocardia brasiliensis TaxID=37326 RepID=UPI0004A76592|nr:hypothetical protein [Nocardia brasiliensis]